MTSVEEGEWPNLRVAYSTSSCYHCAEPICAIVCPAKAILKRNESRDRPRRQREMSHRSALRDHYESKRRPFFGEMPSPCTLACPAGVNVQGYVALISKGRYQEAYDLIRQELPLPSVCGRVCRHPCESACKRQELDDPIAISALKRFVTDRVSSRPDPLPVTKNARRWLSWSRAYRGLFATWELARKGYPVTVFEALSVVGGMLAAGIPDYRLPKEVLQRDVDYLKALGIRIKTNSPIRSNPTLDQLKTQGYDAVFLAIGASKGAKLSIPGARDEGCPRGHFLSAGCESRQET